VDVGETITGTGPELSKALGERLRRSVRFLRRAGRRRPRPGSIVRLDYAPAAVYIHYDSPAESIRTYPCAKEPDTIEWIHTYFRPGDVIFDIGANIGAYALIAGTFLRGAGRIYAFEPAWFNFMQLNRNVALNGLRSCVTPVGLALGDFDGVSVLNYSSLETGSALHTVGSAVDDFGRAFEVVYQQPVAVCTLDGFVSRLRLPVPQHLKIDVDGGEARVLAGAAATLRDPRMRSVLVEVNERLDGGQEVVTALESAGFRVVNRLSKLEAKRRRQGDHVLADEKWVRFADLVNYTFARE
jgi:FkbM family methyltransferase